jgi:hypothetical protein
MTEDLMKQIEELKQEVERLTKRNKLLTRRLNRLKKQADVDDIEDLQEYTKTAEYVVKEIVDSCPKCGSALETITMDAGCLTVCTRCIYRAFKK